MQQPMGMPMGGMDMSMQQQMGMPPQGYGMPNVNIQPAQFQNFAQGQGEMVSAESEFAIYKHVNRFAGNLIKLYNCTWGKFQNI